MVLYTRLGRYVSHPLLRHPKTPYAVSLLNKALSSFPKDPALYFWRALAINSETYPKLSSRDRHHLRLKDIDRALKAQTLDRVSVAILHEHRATTWSQLFKDNVLIHNSAEELLEAAEAEFKKASHHHPHLGRIEEEWACLLLDLTRHGQLANNDKRTQTLREQALKTLDKAFQQIQHRGQASESYQLRIQGRPANEPIFPLPKDRVNSRCRYFTTLKAETYWALERYQTLIDKLKPQSQYWDFTTLKYVAQAMIRLGRRNQIPALLKNYHDQNPKNMAKLKDQLRNIR